MTRAEWVYLIEESVAFARHTLETSYKNTHNGIIEIQFKSLAVSLIEIAEIALDPNLLEDDEEEEEDPPLELGRQFGPPNDYGCIDESCRK